MENLSIYESKESEPEQEARSIRTKSLDSKQSDEDVHGAWAKGKAPLVLITKFMAAIQGNELEAAITMGGEVLEYEPKNSVVQNLVKALKIKMKLDANNDEAESSSEEEDGQESTESGNEDDEDDEESTDSEHDDDSSRSEESSDDAAQEKDSSFSSEENKM